MPKWSKERYVSWSMKPLSSATGWRNIFHFTIGPNNGAIGSRCPALFSNGNNFHFLHWRLIGQALQQINILIPWRMNVFTKYYYEQRYDEVQQDYVFRVFFNDTLIASHVNSNAYEYENVKVYTGNDWYLVSDVIIKDFKFGSL